MEKNFKLIIEYDGTEYHGFQIQPDVKTIQGEIEKCLLRIFQKPIKIYGAGRTDAGVHASGQVAHFIHSSDKSTEQIFRALNGLLPDNIAISEVREVPLDFHARFSAKTRQYRYTIINNFHGNVFLRNYAYIYPYSLDLDLMNKACSVFIGSHDFTSFRVSNDELKSNVRTILKFNCFREKELIITEIEADGFLHMMVRILMGSIVQVGRGRWSVEKLLEIMDAKDRTRGGPTLPARGLCLVGVTY